jgi:multidrug efflux pump subunit AcrB
VKNIGHVRRYRRGEREVPGIDRRGCAVDVALDGDPPDAAAAELPAAVSSALSRTARAHRRRSSAHHRQQTPVAILGVVALIGMILRNSVILVDQIETEISAGRPPWGAVIEATLRRSPPYRPHCSRHNPGNDPNCVDSVLGPMAYVIMVGLCVSTVLALVFLPALYIAWYRVKEQ